MEIESKRAAQEAREADVQARQRAQQARVRKAQPRKWHDMHGILVHEGTCVGCNETIVTVKLDNGDLADVSIEALSTEDQEYVDYILHGDGR